MNIFNFKRRGPKVLGGPDSIERLYVVAGPPACGKSTFLKAVARHLDIQTMPEPWHALLNAPVSMDMAELPKYHGQALGDVVLHVDLMQPFHCNKYFDAKQLETSFAAEGYRSWEALRYLHCARHLHVLTLFLPREELFRRFMLRSQLQQRRVLPFHMVAMYGDSTGNASCLRALYNAWNQYVSDFVGALHCGLDVSTDSYRYCPEFNEAFILDR
ncbi:hypothetical protein [Thalassobacterium sedimentorum]|uniref:hypothetical protein n=1 Tax=Thalassobacterium sedimentorum TaxID=3041258 RepID=UPI002811AABA|nr:hypothetical protein [Coraliomargarita sp. SDUM461004]